MGRQADASESKQREAYERARLSRDTATAISWYMEQEGVSPDELASRLGVSRGEVSYILSGPERISLRTLATVAAALGSYFRIELVPGERGRPREAAGFAVR